MTNFSFRSELIKKNSDKCINFIEQEFLPEQLKGLQIYNPGKNKKENEFRNYLKGLWKDKYDY